MEQWTRDNSLSSREDLVGNFDRNDINRPILTVEETREAMNEMVIDAGLTKFPKFERSYVDPAIPRQNIFNISFVPAKGATPNKDGIFGMAKIRGVFDTPQEAMERCNFLIRHVDSYHHILQGYVGRPFPITLDPRYAEKTEQINIRDKAVEIVSEDVKERRQKERQDIEDMKRREAELVEQQKPDYEPDPEERYTTLKVKKAQMIWTYTENTKKLEQIKQSIIKTRQEIEEIEGRNPDYKERYFERYKKARRDAGIDDSHNTEENFMKYMVEDREPELGF